MRTVVLYAVLAVGTLFAANAWAQASNDPSSEGPSSPLKVESPKRTVGLGTGIGGGFEKMFVWGIFSGGYSNVRPSLLLPTLEVRLFIAGKTSIDLSLPLVNAVALSAYYRTFALSLDTFVNFNLGDAGVRFLLGPGMGLGIQLIGGESWLDLRFPVQLGVEFLSDSRAIGLSIQARPFFDLTVITYSGQVFPGGGVIGVLAFNWYFTKR